MREPRPSDRVRVRDDLEVSPGSLDVVVFSGNTLLGSVRVDVPAVHHVKGATEVVVLRAAITSCYLARLPGPEPSRQAIHRSSRTRTRDVRISSTSSSRLLKLSYVDCVRGHGRTAGSTTTSTTLSTSPTSTSPTASSPPLSTAPASPASSSSPSSSTAAAGE